MTANKENRKTMLIALLVLLVIATGAFIGTIAKYVTSGTASDSAVVAKFGLNVPNTIDLFADSYTNVQADADGKKIIAPGTSGKYDFEIAGTSEVAYKVNADISITYSEEWGEYKPLEFSRDGLSWKGFNLFKTDLESALESETLVPNTAYASEQAIHWRWPYYVSDADDIKDTNVGVKAAEGAAPSVTVTIKVTAVQVD